MNEGQALVRVCSRHTARCLGLERHEGELFLVMEYIPGLSLSDHAARRPLSPDAAAYLVEQVAEGLEAVHACGLIHRDIKPSNIVVGDDGVPRLVDFGLAAHLGSVALQGVSGTPQYMSPEQARGEWVRIDARTDLYGLGGVLYALLTGGPPHPGRTQTEALMHAALGVVTPPHALKRSVPRPLERVVLKALAADPAQRYASAAEMRLALKRYRQRHRRRAGRGGALGRRAGPGRAHLAQPPSAPSRRKPSSPLRPRPRCRASWPCGSGRRGGQAGPEGGRAGGIAAAARRAGPPGGPPQPAGVPIPALDRRPGAGHPALPPAGQ